MNEPTLRELLNRLRWDTTQQPGQVELTVLSRMDGEVALEQVGFAAVSEVLPAGVLLTSGTFLPYHRFVRVQVDGVAVWRAQDRSEHGKP